MDDTRVKRATISIRTSEGNKDALASAAEGSGRSLNQEIEFRLEASLLREKAAGSRDAAMLGDFVGLAAALAERQTGKVWTQDADTFFRVQNAIKTFMLANHPETPDYAKALEAAAAEAEKSAAALNKIRDQAPKTLGDLMRSHAVKDSAAYTKALEDHITKLERAVEASARAKERIDANEAAGQEIAQSMLALFRLQPA